MAGKTRSLLADLSGATKQDILELAEAHHVRFLRLMFTDILGVNKNVEIPSSQFRKALDGDIMFDGSSIEGFVRIEESDMLLAPDLSTLKIFPGGTPESRAHSNTVMVPIRFDCNAPHGWVSTSGPTCAARWTPAPTTSARNCSSRTATSTTSATAATSRASSDALAHNGQR